MLAKFIASYWVLFQVLMAPVASIAPDAIMMQATWSITHNVILDEILEDEVFTIVRASWWSQLRNVHALMTSRPVHGVSVTAMIVSRSAKLLTLHNTIPHELHDLWTIGSYDVFKPGWWPFDDSFTTTTMTSLRSDHGVFDRKNTPYL